MTDLTSQPEKKLSDDIFGTSTYEALPPTQRPFLAWHRPRKQYVRSEQWSVQIEKLYDDLGKDGTLLRYLGLPGTDLLDLRYFHSAICVPRGIDLLFLGFNSDAQDGTPAQVELSISLDEVRKLHHVDPRSLMLPDDICSLANPDSVGFKRAVNLGPYDVVNLDLCDGFAKESPETDGLSQYEALGQLLSLQFRNKNPWLLLLTTRTGNAHVHQDFLDRVVNKYAANLADCEEFRTLSQEKFTISDVDALNFSISSEINRLPVFLTGLCKWILGLAIANSPPSEIEVKSVIGYKVAHDSPCEDLVSLAIRFKPKLSSVSDPMGVIKPAADLPDECKLSVQVLKRIAKRKDADAELASDLDLRNDMANGMADLLSVARYDRSSFIQWVASTEGWDVS